MVLDSNEILINLEKEYQNVVEIILKYTNDDGICNITQNQIAAETGLHQAIVSKIFKSMYNDECIKKIKNSEYQVLRNELSTLGPLTKLMRLLNLLKDNPGMSYTEQSKVLGITIKSLKSTYGLLYGLNGGGIHTNE